MILNSQTKYTECGQNYHSVNMNTYSIQKIYLNLYKFIKKKIIHIEVVKNRIAFLMVWLFGFYHFTLDTYFILLSVKQGGMKYHFKVFGMTRSGIEPRSPIPLANTVPARPMSKKKKKSTLIYLFLGKQTLVIGWHNRKRIRKLPYFKSDGS